MRSREPGGGEEPRIPTRGPPPPIADREPRAHAGLGLGPPGRGGVLSSGAGLKARLQRSLQTRLAALPPEPLAGVGLAVGGRGESLSDDPGRPREPLPPSRGSRARAPLERPLRLERSATCRPLGRQPVAKAKSQAADAPTRRPFRPPPRSSPARKGSRGLGALRTCRLQRQVRLLAAN